MTILNPASPILRAPWAIPRFLPFSSFLFVVVLAAALSAPRPVHGGTSPVVRVLLEEQARRAVITGSSMVVEAPGKNGWETVIKGTRRAGFTASKGSVALEGHNGGSPAFRVRPGQGMLTYAGRQHKGSLIVRASAGGLMVVSHMSLEAYLPGVVNGEIDSSWPLEAVKAQVVASRSYALFRMTEGAPYFDVRPDITDQVYAGPHSEDERAVEAVAETRGQALYRDGKPFQAFFHSTCGGSTTSAADVWGVPQPVQEAVSCGQCQDAPYARWTLSLDAGTVVRTVRALDPYAEDVRSLGIHRRSVDGRVQTLFVETGRGRILVDAGEFRKVLGYRRLPSTRFSLGRSGQKIVFTGEGYGHGVGLCQWGARGSALSGKDYLQILRKYYPGTELRQAY